MTDIPTQFDMTGFIEVFHQPTEIGVQDRLAEQGRFIHPPVLPLPVLPRVRKAVSNA